ncbi:putative transcriptional regulator YdeE [Solibacillus kalamii]|uniref:AraC family transcriptional regulator n=1 Tax=Solibacillus kalamii TaxID=1748298 RepID=A0ABX3ZJM3_9BACL|nr:GyrI-like domain-containing protein [Solibacillus kalamii]MBM7663920.1 putative transcriptional regulator YdeE [Solibacillus kalamii]OUZ39552.1 AraC family transcriptional regulator [Solibacillus kalamii]
MFKMIKKEFKLVGLKGSGEYANFGIEVPRLAKHLLSRSSEIDFPTESEIALYEPKKSDDHTTGNFYVGLIVKVRVNNPPQGMEYIEKNNYYITTRGNVEDLEELHKNLLNWGREQGYKRDLDLYIVETYHPVSKGEEVEIYLPIIA